MCCLKQVWIELNWIVGKPWDRIIWNGKWATTKRHSFSTALLRVHALSETASGLIKIFAKLKLYLRTKPCSFKYKIFFFFITAWKSENMGERFSWFWPSWGTNTRFLILILTRWISQQCKKLTFKASINCIVRSRHKQKKKAEWK